jgi:hypothetical protein
VDIFLDITYLSLLYNMIHWWVCSRFWESLTQEVQPNLKANQTLVFWANIKMSIWRPFGSRSDNLPCKSSWLQYHDQKRGACCSECFLGCTPRSERARHWTRTFVPTLLTYLPLSWFYPSVSCSTFERNEMKLWNHIIWKIMGGNFYRWMSVASEERRESNCIGFSR